MPVRGHWLSLSLALAAACSSAGEATLRVDLRTDLRAPAEFDGFRIAVDGEPVAEGAAPEGDYLRGVRMAELPAVATGRRTLDMTLLEGETVVASGSVIVQVMAPATSAQVVIAVGCAGLCPRPGDDPEATFCEPTGCVRPPEPDVDAGTPEDLGPPPDGGLHCGVEPECEVTECSPKGWCTSGVCICTYGYGGDACDRCAGGWEPMGADFPIICVPPNEVLGTPDRDVLDGTPGDDHIIGFDGDDVIRAQGGADLVWGYHGDDTIFGSTGRDTLTGNTGNDTLYGNEDDDRLFGQQDDDHLEGGGGIDFLSGGPGNDTLDGGIGDDRYLIDGLGEDQILDADGTDVARCVEGLRVVGDVREGGDRLLTFDTGGTVRFVGDTIERVECCP